MEGTQASYIYGLHSSMNYLSLLLFRPCLCFIIYLIEHKVYSIYKYTAGPVGIDGNRERGAVVTHTHTPWCYHATLIDSVTTKWASEIAVE